MKHYPIIKPRQTFKHGILTYELDIRDAGEFQGEDLKKLIFESMKSYTASLILKPLPDWLLLTHRQFVSIMPYTAEMMYTTDRFFMTPFNVMEIEVDINNDTVQEGEVLETFDPMVLAAGQDPSVIETGQVQNSRWAR